MTAKEIAKAVICTFKPTTEKELNSSEVKKKIGRLIVLSLGKLKSNNVNKAMLYRAVQRRLDFYRYKLSVNC